MSSTYGMIKYAGASTMISDNSIDQMIKHAFLRIPGCLSVHRPSIADAKHIGMLTQLSSL